MEFAPGQRWHSLTEPELGLGIVELVEGREVVISYPACELVRRYGREGAPLVRSRLTEGQLARAVDGREFRIERVVEEGAMLRYCGEGQELSEVDLDAQLDVATPENRLRAAQLDPFGLFDLRREALAIRHQMLASPARGFLGGRIELFDHQLSIARDVCERRHARVLLADEVGLGKTIEALLILHRMLLTGRVERVLVLVPPALVHQWLAEAYLRFNLILRVVGRDTHGGEFASADEDLPSELLAAQTFVCPLGTAAGPTLLETHWDLLIVDEAHHLESGSDDLALVEALALQVEHVVLLSATPDRDGEAAHFRRLALLDPARFHDHDAFFREADHFAALAETAERLHRGTPLEARDLDLLRERLGEPELLAKIGEEPTDHAARRVVLAQLLDLHGIGRVMFRNVRARIPGFPRRVACTVDLPDGAADRLHREFLSDIGRDEKFRMVGADRDPRTAWLRQFLDSHPGERVLVLCSDRAKVEAFASALATTTREVARFHEKMSSVERDRQAAWFLAADGPQVLISSAIGAEGRNFQVARNLVLLDLPLEADRVEQLIGRIDRIGQGDEVRVFAAVLPGTPQHRLWRWHKEALDVFERPWHGSPVIDREFGEELLDAVLAPDDAAIDDLIARGRRRNAQIVAELENGRDRLLELTSFDAAAAQALREAVHRADDSRELERFMLDAFERAGLELERIGTRSYAVRAGPDYHRPFPGFVGEEMAVTFDRAIGLEHPERVLLDWDHPMVRDTVDTLLAYELGNATVAQMAGDAPGLLLEALFVAEPTVARALRADRFFPPTPIHIVVDIGGRQVAVDADELRDGLRETDTALLENAQVTAHLPRLLESARVLATAQAPALADAARERMRRELEPAASRLEQLAVVNPALRAADVEAARRDLTELDEGLARVRVRLDALRLIVVGR